MIILREDLTTLEFSYIVTAEYGAADVMPLEYIRKKEIYKRKVLNLLPLILVIFKN